MRVFFTGYISVTNENQNFNLSIHLFYFFVNLIFFFGVVMDDDDLFDIYKNTEI